MANRWRTLATVSFPIAFMPRSLSPKARSQRPLRVEEQNNFATGSTNSETYIGRKRAAAEYRRGERTLERDISQALKVRNETFLTSLRLRTKDGKLIPGMEVTFEKIDKLKNAGQVPTWEIACSYLLAQYGLRSEEPIKEEGSHAYQQKEAPLHNNQEPKPDSPSTGLPPLPRDPVEQAAILKALYRDLHQDLQAERERNDKIFALIETIPKQQEQTNILLREFQELMKSGKPVLPHANTRATHQLPYAETMPIEVKPSTKQTNPVIEVQTKSNETPKPKRVSTKKKKRSSKKRAKKKAPPTFAERHLPSFSRFFNSVPTKKK